MSSSTSDEATPSEHVQARRFAIFCVTAGSVVMTDQVSKAAALSGLSETERTPLVGEMLGLQLAFNPGAMLGLGSSATWLLTVLGVTAVVVLSVAALQPAPHGRRSASGWSSAARWGTWSTGCSPRRDSGADT